MAFQGRRCVILALDGLGRPSYKTFPHSANVLQNSKPPKRQDTLRVDPLDRIPTRFTGGLSMTGCDERASDPNDVPKLVEEMLASARQALASDVHLTWTQSALEMKWRVDGVLQKVTQFTPSLGTKMVTRLKVLADLLTYRTDIPQEGRIRHDDSGRETRVSTFPTLFGEKVAIRLFAAEGRFRFLSDLGLPAEVLETLRQLLAHTSGGIVLTGPAGSGKTTTVYASLKEILDKSAGRRSLVSLEDPIEMVVPGVDQSQVDLPAGFDMENGLRCLLRQDPDVIMVGEIRDRQTAETVFQASLSGHLVVTTFHAGGAAEAVSRLSDMGMEPYLLRSGLLAVLSQRLLRRLCQCARQTDKPEARWGMAVQTVHLPVGCDQCAGTGYRGRMLLAETLLVEPGGVAHAILGRCDAKKLHQTALEAGMVDNRQRAVEAVRQGLTSPEEVFRVMGGESVVSG